MLLVAMKETGDSLILYAGTYAAAIGKGPGNPSSLEAVVDMMSKWVLLKNSKMKVCLLKWTEKFKMSIDGWSVCNIIRID